MRLWIAEKPNVGKTIAAELPGPHRARRHWIECGQGETVAWCVGHLLEPAMPEVYDPRLKAWRVEDLPFIPEGWRLVPKEDTRDVLEALGQLLSRASSVVHAGDRGREGQLLVEEVLEHFQYRGPVLRLRTDDLTPVALRSAMQVLEPNTKFASLGQAALARQRADFLYGINLTRLYTVKGRQAGHDGVLSVGRVQTPVLALVVDRDREIENFQPKTFYALRASVVSPLGFFSAMWKPGASVEPSLDTEGRLLDRGKAAELAKALTGAAGTCTRSTLKRETASAPLPYSLAELQVDSDRLLGLTAQQTLDACQALYEVFRLTTYPRTDCSYVPESQFPDAPAVLASVAANCSSLAGLVSSAGLAKKPRAFDDKKVGEHHAIIPTGARIGPTPLPPAEAAVYELICRRYIGQFYGPHVFNSAHIELTFEGETFIASGRQTLDEGWRVTLPPRPRGQSAGGARPADEMEAAATQPLPPIEPGAPVRAERVDALEKKTRPPKRFSDGTLIEAMIGISRFVENQEIRHVLMKLAAGIGTSATRAAIIETLFRRGFLRRDGKHVVSTALGRVLIDRMPPLARKPDLTAVWELAMLRISQGEMTVEAFLQPMVAQLRQLLQAGAALATRAPLQATHAPR